jgi:hypothetical protein
VTVDADYGSNAAFRRGLERLGLRYGVAIRGALMMWTAEAGQAHSAATLADAVPAHHWIPVTWGTGTTGPLSRALPGAAGAAHQGALGAPAARRALG